MEGNCPKKDANIASRSSEPFIQIDSISIDLISSDDKIDCEKCEHFSIRRFVSETRKKDWKMCCPFAFDGDQECEDQTSLLPPLEIPNFSWWRCPNCQREISSKDFHHVPKLGTMEKIEISNSTNLTDTCNPPLCTGVIGERPEVIYSITGNAIGSEDEANMEMHRFSSLAPKIKSSVVLRCINDSVAPKPESNEFRESRLTGHGSCKVGALELSIMNLKVNSGNQVENLQIGKQISIDDDCRVFFQASDIGRVLCKAHNAVAVRDQSKSNPCIEVNRRKLSAAEFAEISTGNDIQDSHVHKSNGSLRRKSRKLRLLTELLGENRSMKNKQVEVAGDSLSNGTSDTLYVPPSQVVIQGNNSRSLGQSRKRKMHRDEEWRPREITSCNKNKNVMALKEDIRTNDSRAGSKFENPSLQMRKSLWRKNTSDGDHKSGRKKYKKPKALNPGFPLLRFGENVQQEIQEKHASEYSWMDSFPSTGAKMKSKPSMSKKKGKMEVKQVMETPFALDKYLLRLGSTSTKDVETMGNEPMATPFQSRKDEFSERGLHLSLSSYMAAQRLDTNCVPREVDGLPSFQPQQGRTSGVIQFSGKAIENNRLVDSTSHLTSPPAFLTHRMPFPIERQQLTPQFEDSVCFISQRMGIAGPSSSMKNTEVEESMTMKKKQNCKRVDKVFEKEAADDIPMEIVELMAKNQFERENEYAENKKRLPETIGIAKNAPTAYYGNSQEQESNRPKPQAKKKVNGVITAREVVGLNKQNSVDYLSHISGCHFSTNHLQQMQSSEGYGAVLQTQQKPYGEIQYSAAGSSETGNAQKEKYAFGGYGEGLPVSSENEERGRLCSQMMMDHLPCGYNLPQNYSFKSINADKASNGHISRDTGNLNAQPDLKLHNENSINIEKKIGVYGLQALGRTNTERPYSYQSSTVDKIQKNAVKPLDLCSNETIPAMHLLTLMDAGMQTTPPFTPAGMSRFPKKSAFPRNLKSNEFSGFNNVSNNKIDPVRFPSSDHYSRSHPSEKSPDCFPACSTLDASTSSQQGFRASNFTGHLSSKLPEKEMAKRSKKCAVTNDGMRSDNSGGLAVHNVQNSFFNPADSKLLKKNSFSQRIFEDLSSNAMSMTQKRPTESVICTVNRNPSDFSLPEAGNIYTIGSDDLKFGRKISIPNQPGSIVSDGRKRKRKLKHNAAKESARMLILS